MDKKDISSCTLEELVKEIEQMGEKAFRAKQTYEWLHVKLAEHFDVTEHFMIDALVYYGLYSA